MTIARMMASENRNSYIVNFEKVYDLSTVQPQHLGRQLSYSDLKSATRIGKFKPII